ncbi:MAG: beta-N-acetylglucosaminidase domain-containing protein [Fibrobacteria bacterium]|nr:beta-N-acetylglucosaminidase domain-containing protein [Fibrobacteria bacterium]
MHSMHTGYIEGYYGNTLNWQHRFDMLRHLHHLGLNTYVYAPKEDLLHRMNWRKPYSADWLKTFRNLVSEGKKQHVNVVYSIAPGLSYDYSSKKDYRTLLAKIKQLLSTGITTVALLMDDIDDKLPSKLQTSFSSLGDAHARLLQQLSAELCFTRNQTALWFCPTIYTDAFTPDKASATDYMQDLANGTPENIPLFWTGPDVVAKDLSKVNIRHISTLFKGGIIIWDNYFANDYCPDNLFLGPFKGRSANLLKDLCGYCINPTGYYETDKMYLELMTGYLKGQAPKKTWTRITSKHNLPKEFFNIAGFLNSPFSSFSVKTLSSRKIQTHIKNLHHLLFTWKSPFQIEWYPFLHRLYRDLNYISKKPTIPAEKLVKKYPPLLRNLLK